MMRRPRIAIVSDPLVQRGGAERVVEAMARTFPDAPVYTIVYSQERGPGRLAPRVRESWLGRIPGAAHRHRLFLPFFPGAVESFDLSSYDARLRERAQKPPAPARVLAFFTRCRHRSRERRAGQSGPAKAHQ
jgi:hypothetical protein